jgi:MarR family transcriptional regulator, 2-MHQ and catechol-resistance regulon repressor
MGTHFKGTKKEILSLNVYIKLMRAAESLSTRVLACAVDKELTVSQFSILEALYHLGPLCQKDLAHKLLKTGGNITMVVDNLEKLGFVQRERSASDRRYFSIHLTKQGKALIEKIFPKHVDAIVEEFSVLSDEELKQLERMLKQVGIKEPEEEEV